MMISSQALSTLDWLIVLALVSVPLLGALARMEWLRRRDPRRRRPGYLDLTRRPW